MPGCDRLTQSRYQFQGGGEAALYTAAHLMEVLPRAGDVDAGQVVVGGLLRGQFKVGCGARGK